MARKPWWLKPVLVVCCRCGLRQWQKDTYLVNRRQDCARCGHEYGTYA